MASEMVCQVKVLTTKPDDMSSTPGTQVWKERSESYKSSDSPTLSMDK